MSYVMEAQSYIPETDGKALATDPIIVLLAEDNEADLFGACISHLSEFLAMGELASFQRVSLIVYRDNSGVQVDGLPEGYAGRVMDEVVVWQDVSLRDLPVVSSWD
jgi:hypothetical protein